MRISDWSSDVCSSDLSAARALLPGDLRRQGVVRIMRPLSGVLRRRRWPAAGTKSGVSTKMAEQAPEVGIIMGSQSDWPTMRHAADRSEEHTSELQSLMRTSYAGVCLKKKRHNHDRTTETTRDEA